MNITTIAETLGFEIEEVTILIEMFSENAEESLQTLQHAILTQDYEAIRQSSHAIKGSASNLLLTEIASLASTIEHAASNKEPITYEAKSNELKILIEGLQDHAKETV